MTDYNWWSKPPTPFNKRKMIERLNAMLAAHYEREYPSILAWAPEKWPLLERLIEENARLDSFVNSALDFEMQPVDHTDIHLGRIVDEVYE